MSDDFIRQLGPGMFAFVEAIVQAADTDGGPAFSEEAEAEMMRGVRRAAALMGAVSALIVGHHEGDKGLRILAETCADHIAADPSLVAAFRAAAAGADDAGSPVYLSLLRLVAERRTYFIQGQKE